MKVEVYGIPQTVFNCYGCKLACDILQEVGISYDFVQVITSLSDDGIPTYEKDIIRQLADRLGQVSLSISYPVIFINEERVYLKHLRDKLVEYGYDAEL